VTPSNGNWAPPPEHKAFWDFTRLARLKACFCGISYRFIGIHCPFSCPSVLYGTVQSLTAFVPLPFPQFRRLWRVISSLYRQARLRCAVAAAMPCRCLFSDVSSPPSGEKHSSTANYFPALSSPLFTTFSFLRTTRPHEAPGYYHASRGGYPHVKRSFSTRQTSRGNTLQDPGCFFFRHEFSRFPQWAFYMIGICVRVHGTALWLFPRFRSALLTSCDFAISFSFEYPVFPLYLPAN